MNFEEFTGAVQHRLGLLGTGDAVHVSRVTLMILDQRIPEGNAGDFAASLLMEIKWYLTGAVHLPSQRFDWQEFVSRDSGIGGGDRPIGSSL